MDQNQQTSKTRQPILVSACLLGLPTRYDGKTKTSQAVADFLKRENLIPVPVCPEQLAGMTTPREKTFFHCGDGCDVLAGTGTVVSETGKIMNEIFRHGAAMALQIAQLSGCKRALLKERSPSCGVHQIYLGEQATDGMGVTAALLASRGLNVISEEDLPL